VSGLLLPRFGIQCLKQAGCRFQSVGTTYDKGTQGTLAFIRNASGGVSKVRKEGAFQFERIRLLLLLLFSAFGFGMGCYGALGVIGDG
jgi:hypothetical protein